MISLYLRNNALLHLLLAKMIFLYLRNNALLHLLLAKMIFLYLRNFATPHLLHQHPTLGSLIHQTQITLYLLVCPGDTTSTEQDIHFPIHLFLNWGLETLEVVAQVKKTKGRACKDRSAL